MNDNLIKYKSIIYSYYYVTNIITIIKIHKINEVLLRYSVNKD